MKTLFRNRHKQSGQATLEMILLLVIGMMIALGLIYRFNTAFRKYTIDMYGTYYRCLLETGELPGVQSVCQDRKARFDIANGKKLVTDSGGSGGGGSSSGSGSSSSGKGSSSGGSGKTTSGKSPSGSSGGGGSGGSSSGSSPEAVASGGGGGGRGSSVIGRLRDLQKSKSTAVGSAGGSKDSSEGGPAPIIAVGKSPGNFDNLRSPRTKMNFEMDGADYKRAESAAVTATTATSKGNAKKGESGDSLRPRKAVENTERKVAGKLDEDKGGGFEFGKLFRLFLIFAIIVAILFFLGGQVLQISKSGER